MGPRLWPCGPQSQGRALVGRAPVGNSPLVGEGLEEGRNLQACRCHLHSCEEAQSQAEALDDQVAHRVGERYQQRAVACLVVAASQLGRYGLG